LSFVFFSFFLLVCLCYMHVLVGYLLLRAKKNENVAKVVIIDDGDDDDDDDEYKV